MQRADGLRGWSVNHTGHSWAPTMARYLGRWHGTILVRRRAGGALRFQADRPEEQAGTSCLEPE
eukprot:12553803-Heterocapsa_arctica.AAC.1